MNKNILHIAPTPFFSDRGCHIRIEGIARCLNELGYDNTVCTYHHGRDVAGISTKRIKTIRNYTKTEAGPSKYKILADWRLLTLVIKEYRRLKPSVIHAHLHEGLLIGLLVKWLFFWRRTPVIGDMQGSLSGELEAHGSFKKKPYLKWPVKTLEWCLMKLANHIVCSSQHSLDIIQSEFSVKENSISLAQDGADIATPLPIERRKQLQSQWTLPTDKTIVVYSGALLDSKGLNELKEIIKNSDPNNVHFLVIGYPKENIEPYLEQENLLARCTLTGRVDFEQLSDYLSLAEIAIDPKNNNSGEGSGKMLNYLACGLVVLAFDTTNNKEFLAEGSLSAEGSLHAEGSLSAEGSSPAEGSQLAKDVEQLTQRLNKLAKNKSLRDKISSANLKRFEQNYSWQICKDQLSALYSRL